MQFAWPIAEPPSSIAAGLKFGALRTTTTPPHDHGGVDLAFGKVQTPVYAAAPGQVTVSTAYDKLGGPAMIYIAHDEGFETRYMHLDPQQLEVKKGDSVERGDLIGRVGPLSSGPHLHFEILDNGTRLDPEPLLYAGVDPEVAGAGLGVGLGGILLAAATYYLLRRFL
jgi:murein DD-endopeptidase MepM/ murein hydrolase activator NlpD